MNNKVSSKERQHFETWAKTYGLLLFRSDSEYKMFDTQMAWYAWQAAKADERKRMVLLVQKIRKSLKVMANKARAIVVKYPK